jgi:hypothetical protein
MKLKALFAAIVATAAATPAFALVPGQTYAAYPDSTYPVLHIYASGATATDKQLKSLARQIYKPGTLDIFTDDLTKHEGNKYSYYYGVVDSTTIPALGTAKYKLFIHKNSNGGSANGIVPVANNAIEDQVALFKPGNVPNFVFDAANPLSIDTAADGAGNVNVWKVDRTFVDNTNIVDFGISDVEPALFAARGLSFNSSNLVSAATNANTFGIAVTTKLRNALQAAQGLVVGSDLEANAPSLSKSQISSLVSGGITSWDQFRVTSGATTVGLTAAPGVVAPVNDAIQIARRVNDSGTQAQAEQFYNNFPYTAGTEGFLADNTEFSSVDVGAQADDNIDNDGQLGSIVHEFAGSGGVIDALNALNDANAWGVGVLSLEKSGPKYRFIKIDGVAPTLKNVADNKYHNWSTATINWRASINAPTGDKLKILNIIKTDASKSSNIKLINDSINTGSSPVFTDAGDVAKVGLLTLAYRAGTNKVFSYANPVMTASREGITGGDAPNSGKIPVVYGNNLLK